MSWYGWLWVDVDYMKDVVVWVAILRMLCCGWLLADVDYLQDVVLWADVDCLPDVVFWSYGLSLTMCRT